VLLWLTVQPQLHVLAAYQARSLSAAAVGQLLQAPNTRPVHPTPPPPCAPDRALHSVEPCKPLQLLQWLAAAHIQLLGAQEVVSLQLQEVGAQPCAPQTRHNTRWQSCLKKHRLLANRLLCPSSLANKQHPTPCEAPRALFSLVTRRWLPEAKAAECSLWPAFDPADADARRLPMPDCAFVYPY